ncbi:MAG: hypothetical protein QM607_01910 [Microbacterium sp.]
MAAVGELDLVDAHAGAIESAEAIILFGTRHWSPAELAASLYRDGLAPRIGALPLSLQEEE